MNQYKFKVKASNHKAKKYLFGNKIHADTYDILVPAFNRKEAEKRLQAIYQDLATWTLKITMGPPTAELPSYERTWYKEQRMKKQL